MEEETVSVQTQLSSLQQWEPVAPAASRQDGKSTAPDRSPITTCRLSEAAESTRLSSASSDGKGPTSPPPVVQADPNYDREELPTPSPPQSFVEDADRDDKRDDYDDYTTEELREMDDASQDADTTTVYCPVSKRSRSISEDRGDRPKRWQSSTVPFFSTTHADSRDSNGRCVSVQSQWELYPHDLMIIFSTLDE